MGYYFYIVLYKPINKNIMSRILVEYAPNITKESRNIIDENVTHSMEAYDGSSKQYNLSSVINRMEDGTIKLIESDLKVLTELLYEGVGYIEF